jgi:N-acetyl-anhydromuramyl-L-alanine amidase AmpD
MYTCIPAPSPNFTNVEIPVDFIVLHYTATSLPQTLKIFADPERKVSAHLVIDRNGDVYEVVRCITGPALRAWHAGVSRMTFGSSTRAQGGTLEGFNDFSIGIELVNVNGNVFPYTDPQYHTLISVLRDLRARYPQIDTFDRIVGHEEIAGFRGKCDPGVLFDWKRLQEGVFPTNGASKEKPVSEHPHSEHVFQKRPLCTDALARTLARLYGELGVGVDPLTGEFIGVEGNRTALEAVSSLLEAALEAGVRSSSSSDERG